MLPIPADVKIACERPTRSRSTGADRQRVGQVAAEIRAYRPPEPYKGKGIKYATETSAARKARRSRAMPDKSKALFLRRRQRVRRSCAARNDRPRLSVFRSSKHIYAQIIDDATGVPWQRRRASMEGSRRRSRPAPTRRGERRRQAGRRAGQGGRGRRAVFDRGAYLFHGRVKALADAAREGGLISEGGLGMARDTGRGGEGAATATGGRATARTASSPRSWSTSIASPRW